MCTVVAAGVVLAAAVATTPTSAVFSFVRLRLRLRWPLVRRWRGFWGGLGVVGGLALALRFAARLNFAFSSSTLRVCLGPPRSQGGGECRCSTHPRRRLPARRSISRPHLLAPCVLVVRSASTLRSHRAATLLTYRSTRRRSMSRPSLLQPYSAPRLRAAAGSTGDPSPASDAVAASWSDLVVAAASRSAGWAHVAVATWVCVCVLQAGESWYGTAPVLAASACAGPAVKLSPHPAVRTRCTRGARECRSPAGIL